MEDNQTIEPFMIAFGIKSTVETIVDGVVGILTQGYASKFNVVDQDGEYQVPGSFKDIDDSWGRQTKPLVLYNHGYDPVLMGSPIGWGVKYTTDDQGLYVECFIPRDPQPPFKDEKKLAKFRQIYEGLKSGKIRGYSVGGVFKRIKNALIQWSMTELTITPTPCLDVAQFGLGQKAVKAMLDNPFGFADPSVADLPTNGVQMPDWTKIMEAAQGANDPSLHDFLLHNYPDHTQGEHSAKSCPVCSTRRGAKSDSSNGGFLVTEEDGTQHLPTKKNDKLDHGLMGAAYAALTSNYRGQAYSGPGKEEALSKLKALYKSEGMDVPAEKSDGKATEMCSACKSSGAGCKACTCDGCNADGNGGKCLCEEANANSDAGAKAIKDAMETIQVFTQGVKAGRQFSKQNLDKFAKIIQMLQDVIAMQKEDLKGEGKDTPSESSDS